MEENLIDIYTEKIKNSTDPGLVISQLYYSLFSLPQDIKITIMFRKFVKVYGRTRVLGSLLEAYGMDNLDPKNIYGLLLYFIKKEISKAPSEPIMINTSEITAKLASRKKLKLKELFDE